MSNLTVSRLYHANEVTLKAKFNNVDFLIVAQHVILDPPYVKQDRVQNGVHRDSPQQLQLCRL